MKFDLIQSLYPTTVVDLNQNQVYQSAHSILAHRHERRKYKEEEIKALKRKPADSFESFSGIHKDDGKDIKRELVKDCSPFIINLLNESLRLPTSLREGMMIHARRLLVRKAAILIKYVNSVSSRDRDRNESLNHTLIKRMKTDLGASSNADWFITLAIAEKYSPGINKKISEDIQKIEDRFNELYWVL